MAGQEVSPSEVPVMLDSESLAIMRQLYPGKMDTKDYESWLKEKSNQAFYKHAQRKQIALSGNPYMNQMQLNPQVVELLTRFGQEDVLAGSISPPNVGGGVEGGFLPALAGLVPGLVGALITGVPQFIRMIKAHRAKKKAAAEEKKRAAARASAPRYAPRFEPEPEPEGQEQEPEQEPEPEPAGRAYGSGDDGGAIAPPNLRRGGLATEFLQAIIPAAQRVEARAANSKSGAEFFHNLARGLKGEIPQLLSRYTKAAPQHISFLTEKIMSKIGVPKGFSDFVKEEVGRIGSKVADEAAPRVEKFSAKVLGSGDPAIRGAGIKELVKPVLKWILSKAMHKIGPVNSLYKKAKDVMGSITDVYNSTEPTGAAGGAPGYSSGRYRGRTGERRGVMGNVGDLARRVLGETLQKAAPAGSSMLGKAVDSIAEKFLGAPTTIGSDIAQAVGESVIRSTGEAIVPSRRGRYGERRERYAREPERYADEDYGEPEGEERSDYEEPAPPVRRRQTAAPRRRAPRYVEHEVQEEFEPEAPTRRRGRPPTGRPRGRPPKAKAAPAPPAVYTGARPGSFSVGGKKKGSGPRKLTIKVL